MLSEWLKNHKAKTLPSGEKIVKADPKHLTKLQESYNVYEPIEAYEEKWGHIESTDEDGSIIILASPIEGTRCRSDLPPLNVQWKQDWKRRLKAIKKHEENKQ
jgi:hypothetical protein